MRRHRKVSALGKPGSIPASFRTSLLKLILQGSPSALTAGQVPERGRLSTFLRLRKFRGVQNKNEDTPQCRQSINLFAKAARGLSTKRRVRLFRSHRSAEEFAPVFTRRPRKSRIRLFVRSLA